MRVTDVPTAEIEIGKQKDDQCRGKDRFAGRAGGLHVAEEARQRALAGEDFAALAGEYSEEPGAAERGGLLQPGREGTWVDPFWQAALALVPRIDAVVLNAAVFLGEGGIDALSFTLIRLAAGALVLLPLVTLSSRVGPCLGRDWRAALALAVIPLMIAAGAGAAARPHPLCGQRAGDAADQCLNHFTNCLWQRLQQRQIRHGNTSAGFQHARDLQARRAVVAHMLEDLVAEDHIEHRVGERQLLTSRGQQPGDP